MGLEVSFEGVHSSLRQDLTSDGSEFQVCGAATEKDRRANSELCDTHRCGNGKKVNWLTLHKIRHPSSTSVSKMKVAMEASDVTIKIDVIIDVCIT